ncbi:MAG TPA: transporter substrate-binding domain-containing protein [Rhodospirillales bacterium]|nr:transporter substrate-binding domain-containing protein [Rhodospirillales bacterium]
MIMLWRRAGAAAAVLLSLTWLGGEAATRPLDDVRESGTIRIAVYRDFTPFSDVRDGRFSGVDVDIGRAIGERLGVGVEFMPVTAGESVDDDLRNAVWKGHYLGGGVADVMLHVPVDRRFAMRNKLVAVFGAYARMDLVVAGSGEIAGRALDPEAIGDARIGVELATLADAYLLSAFSGALRDNVVHYPSTVAAAEALAHGEVEAALGTRAEIEAGLGQRREGFTLSPVEIPGSSWLIGAAVDEHSRDLGYAVGDILVELVQGGTVAAAFASRALSYLPPEDE